MAASRVARALAAGVTSVAGRRPELGAGAGAAGGVVVGGAGPSRPPPPRRGLATAPEAVPPPPAPGAFVELAGGGRVAITTALELVGAAPAAPIPCYRALDEQGRPTAPGDDAADLPKDLAVRMYEEMVRLHTMDTIFNEAQRQGRFSFYMTARGEEAVNIASAAALEPEDVVLAQYREQGVLLWRGWSVRDFADQCYSNVLDLGKGRQMPIHYGSKELNFVTISSPLATQIPQAVGAAYADKAAGRENATVCYFGEGAASEGDFHAGCNFAATLGAPVVFFCRNNGYAISTPSREQYRGDGIAGRGQSYGIPSFRVDGNDTLAVYRATREARRHVVETGSPVLLEAMSYRSGHHSTSDDSSRYRAPEEMARWRGRDPIPRFRNFLEARGWWTDEGEAELLAKVRRETLEALDAAEALPKPPLRDMVEDVYDVPPPLLREQAEAVRRFAERFPQDVAPLNLAPDDHEYPAKKGC